MIWQTDGYTVTNRGVFVNVPQSKYKVLSVITIVRMLFIILMLMLLLMMMIAVIYFSVNCKKCFLEHL